MKKQNGFSLVELMTVVAIVTIIAAIAVPALLKAKLAANESSAIGSIRTVTDANTTYSQLCPTQGYAASLAELNAGLNCSAGAGAIDAQLAAGTRTGYTVTYAAVKGGDGLFDTYTVMAVPQTIGTTGYRSFCSDQSGAIHYVQAGTGCTAAAPILQQ